MKEIINKNNIEYAQSCFDEALKLGFDFKLNNNFKEKNIKKKTLKNY